MDHRIKPRLGVFARIGLAVAGLSALVAAAPVSAAAPAGQQFQQIRLITIPGVPPAKGAWSFDIGTTDAAGTYYLADRTSKALDVVSGHTLVAQIGGFVGAHIENGKVNNDLSGPNGALIVESRREAWVGDGDSTAKVVDLNTRKIVASISTGGTKRADEEAYDPIDGIVLMANDADDPPFLSFISVADRKVLAKVPYPDATNGIEQPAWNAANDMFYVAIPQTKTNQGGQIDQLDPKSMKVVNTYPVQNCVPHGLAIGPNQQAALGCSGDAINLLGATAQTQIMDLTSGKIVATVNQVGGSDEVWYNAGDNMYYAAASNMTSDGTKAGKVTPVIGVIDAGTNTWIANAPTKGSAHSVAASALTNQVYVPAADGLRIYAFSAGVATAPAPTASTPASTKPVPAPVQAPA